eukprot:Skav221700  [mRNA]  locus=scaffold1494:422035:430339:+ [translate_table: standard]
MVELRSAGFIEICGDLDPEHGDILETLDEYFGDRFAAARIDGHEDFCDRYYQAGEGIFKGASGSLESNFGLLCTNVCDQITQWEGWSLVACNASNYGADGLHSEQQMIFRRDYHPLGDSKYLQVILNALGNIEVNGKHVKEIHSKLDGFLRHRWGCDSHLHVVADMLVVRGWANSGARGPEGSKAPGLQYSGSSLARKLRIRGIGPGSDRGKVSPELLSVMQEPRVVAAWSHAGQRSCPLQAGRATKQMAE